MLVIHLGNFALKYDRHIFIPGNMSTLFLISAVACGNIHTEKSYQIKQKSDCIDDFTIDLEPNERPFGS